MCLDHNTRQLCLSLLLDQYAIIVLSNYHCFYSFVSYPSCVELLLV